MFFKDISVNTSTIDLFHSEASFSLTFYGFSLMKR